jgi:ABC-type bacteriocin/lantibiotic exporter with double-glycine peptidase domain
MKTSSHFSSKNSALVLGTVLTASTLFAGFTLAQSALSIPTNLSNAVITIQKIVLSTVGTNALLSNPGSTIALDGANGNITTQPPTA